MKEDLDKRIERVAESVGLKKAAMHQWESDRVASEMRRKVAKKRWGVYGISAAASVVVICGVGLGVFLKRGGDVSHGAALPASVPAYRVGPDDIEEIRSLMDASRYQEALYAIESAMADTIIDPTYPEERREYLRSVNRNQAYELTWLKIQVLIKLNKEQEACELLESYINQAGSHQTEAYELLQELIK